MKGNVNNFGKAGFSLIEIMLVLTIISMLLVLSISMMTGVISAIDLSTAATEVATIFKRAREEALTRNEIVQIRIYRTSSQTFQDEVNYQLAMGVVNPPESPGDPGYNEPESFPITLIGKRYLLPESATFMESAPYSTMISGISEAPKNVLKGAELINGVQTPYTAFSFTPDNRAALAAGHDWTLTLVGKNGLKNHVSLPDNFITIQLLPETGKANLIQP